MAQRWLIYGANGYTGRLIAREARRRGMAPILAGRNREEISSLGQELGLETRVFDLEDPRTIAENLAGAAAVLHCAGPFSATHRPMFKACLRSKTHYLDITGEIRVFESVFSQRRRILEAGISAIAGVGFDVVPSDCLAATLKRDLPDASRLSLGFKSTGRPSPGTLKTIIEGLSVGGVVRQDGKLISTAPAHKERLIRFDQEPEPAVCVPWGDVSTAFYSTGIANIEVYMALPKRGIRLMRGLRWIRPFLALRSAQFVLKLMVEMASPGDTPAQRASARTWLWGQATAPGGRRVERRISAPGGYDITAEAAVAAMGRILDGNVKPGPWTPSLAFGPEFVSQLKGVSLSGPLLECNYSPPPRGGE